jgi:hypothetical protein
MRPALASLAAVLVACGANQTHPIRQAYVAPQQQALACVPNLDGRIDANELQAAVGIPESLLVSPAGVTRAVDLEGAVDDQGHRTWDFGTDYADDQVARIAAQDLSGKWYANSFPTGQFATAIDAADTLEGVYLHDDQAVWLLGIASTQEHPPEGQTLLVYSQPVVLFRFPLQVGASWVSAGEVQNGVIRDLPYAGRDTYQVSVDAAGELILPDLTFQQALRVRTALTQEPAVGASVQRQQTSFIVECFGEVARATSQNNETNQDFTTAAELRRLSLERSTP